MKALLPMAAVLMLSAGCYVGDTEGQVQITSVRVIQPDPEGEICAEDLPSTGGGSYSSTDPTLVSIGRTLFFRSNVSAQAYGFGQTDVVGAGHNDFRLQSMVYEYASDTLTLPNETETIFFTIPELTNNSCAQTSVLGTQARNALAGIVVSQPTDVTVSIHFEGTYVNGKADQTNTIRYPVTIYP